MHSCFRLLSGVVAALLASPSNSSALPPLPPTTALSPAAQTASNLTTALKLISQHLPEQFCRYQAFCKRAGCRFLHGRVIDHDVARIAAAPSAAPSQPSLASSRTPTSQV